MNATDLMVQKFDVPKETLPICTDAQEIENSAETMAVTSAEGFEKGAKALAVIKFTKKKVVNALKDQKTHAHAVHKSICEYESKISAPLEHAEDVLKEKMSDWYLKEQEYEEEMLASGKKITSSIPKLDNIGVRENWKAEVIDESKVPQQFWSVDRKKLAEYAKTNKGMLEVDGVEFKKGITIINNS